MSVVIKGFKMPEDCRDCPLEIYYMNSGETRCRAGNKILAENFKVIPFDDRPDWCPLVEVPAPHGRLIDADVLKQHIDKLPALPDGNFAGNHSALKALINMQPTVQPEAIYCGECAYYDPPHVENNGMRYEYAEMPNDAFDELGTGLVNAGYGINVGGRCCRDYNVMYDDDKRVFVTKNNYCGRAERRTDEK